MMQMKGRALGLKIVVFDLCIVNFQIKLNFYFKSQLGSQKYISRLPKGGHLQKRRGAREDDLISSCFCRASSHTIANGFHKSVAWCKN